jgi:hypothetical protein
MHSQAAGTAKPSFTSNLLEHPDEAEAEDDFIKAAASIIYTGGSDTVSMLRPNPTPLHIPTNAP